MYMEEFEKTVKWRIKDYLPEQYKDAEVTVSPVMKNNDITLHGMAIRRPGETASPTIHLNGYYKDYISGKPLEDIFKEMADSFMKHQEQAKTLPSIDFEAMKDKIFFTLSGVKTNQAILANSPHRVINDMAITYRVLAYDNGFEKGSISITNSVMERMGMTEPELFTRAMEQTPQIMPSNFFSMEELFKDIPWIQADEIIEDMPLYVVTNDDKWYGAGAIFYPGVKEDIFKYLREEYYVLPSFVHESIILPKSYESDIKYLKDMVHSVNMTEVEPQEVLTDSVYEYDARANTITIAGDIRYKANVEDIKRMGCRVTKSLVKNIESLNKATGRNNTIKEAREIFKSENVPDNVKEIAGDIVKEVAIEQQMSQGLEM